MSEAVNETQKLIEAARERASWASGDREFVLTDRGVRRMGTEILELCDALEKSERERERLEQRNHALQTMYLLAAPVDISHDIEDVIEAFVKNRRLMGEAE